MTCLPWALAQARIRAVRSLWGRDLAARAAERRTGALRAAVTNGASASRSRAALALLRSIS